MMCPRISLVVAAALFLAGCAPALSPELTESADPSLSFSQLRSDPAAHAGKIVILCGVIVGLRHVAGGTEIEIQQKAPDYWGKPQRTDHSGGRFLVRRRAQLDPLIYSPGREITVGGVVMGAENGLAVLEAKEMQLWGRYRPAPGDPSWMDPLSDRGLH